MKKSWGFRLDPAKFAKFTNFIIKYWKETVFVSSFLALILAIFFAVSITNIQLKEAEKNASINSIKYSVVNSWKGTNGEVIKSFTVDTSNVYMALGQDGFSIFDKLTLDRASSLVTNLSINDVAVKTFGTSTLAFLAVGGIETPGGIAVCDVTENTNIKVINSILTSNSICENIKLLGGEGKPLNILLSDNNSGFVYYTYDPAKNLLLQNLLGSGRNYPGIGIDADNKLICSVSKSGTVYLYNWKGELLSMISNSLSMANSVSIYSNFLIIGDRMAGAIIYNASDPRNCGYVVNYNTSGDTYDAFERDNSIYIADGINGILKVRRDKFSEFILEKQFNDGAIYNKLFYSPADDEIYAGCGKDGFKILK